MVTGFRHRLAALGMTEFEMDSRFLSGCAGSERQEFFISRSDEKGIFYSGAE
jgi:hypothetical protein